MVRLKLLHLLTNPSGWSRLAWSEMHGAPMRRWHLDETVRQVGGHAHHRFSRYI